MRRSLPRIPAVYLAILQYQYVEDITVGMVQERGGILIRGQNLQPC